MEKVNEGRHFSHCKRRPQQCSPEGFNEPQMLSKYRTVSKNKDTFLQRDFKKEEEEKEEEEVEGNVSMMEAVQESYQL